MAVGITRRINNDLAAVKRHRRSTRMVIFIGVPLVRLDIATIFICNGSRTGHYRRYIGAVLNEGTVRTKLDVSDGRRSHRRAGHERSDSSCDYSLHGLALIGGGLFACDHDAACERLSHLKCTIHCFYSKIDLVYPCQVELHSSRAVRKHNGHRKKSRILGGGDTLK